MLKTKTIANIPFFILMPKNNSKINFMSNLLCCNGEWCRVGKIIKFTSWPYLSTINVLNRNVNYSYIIS